VLEGVYRLPLAAQSMLLRALGEPAGGGASRTRLAVRGGVASFSLASGPGRAMAQIGFWAPLLYRLSAAALRSRLLRERERGLLAARRRIL